MILALADDSFSRLQLENRFLREALINLKLLFEYKSVWKGEWACCMKHSERSSRKVLYEKQEAEADKWSKSCFSSFYWSSL